ncbi:hypothetical protein BGP_6478 [Beggiatoa sp. PS]|nr:hypothetical protein BGP_6478 [Beggiatoa sp. PS]
MSDCNEFWGNKTFYDFPRLKGRTLTSLRFILAEKLFDENA